VALVKAISTACGLRLTPREVAERACEIEVVKLGKPVGVQDQYAAAFGGFNWMTFSPEGITVERMAVPTDTISRLESSLVLAFTGTARDSAVILGQQSRSSSAGDPVVIGALDGVLDLAVAAKEILLAGDVRRLGLLLHESWKHKRKFAPGVTNERIERSYALARRNGALGGKVAGAGGGGFLLLCCEEGSTGRVQAALNEEGVHCLEFRLESDGARVLFNAGLRLPTHSPAEPLPAGRTEGTR